MSKFFWVLFPLESLLFMRALSNPSVVNIISLIILSAAVFYQVRAYRALREYENTRRRSAPRHETTHTKIPPEKQGVFS